MSLVIDKVKKLRLKEKEIVAEILDLLQIIQDQRLYVTCNVNSMFKFCTRVLGYSETEATIRINALRISKALPEIKKEISTGEINLTQASMLGAFLSKNQGSNIKVIKEQVKTKTISETKFILDQIQNPNTKQDLKITLPEHIAKKLQKFAKDENLDLVEAIDYLLNQKTTIKEESKESQSKNQRYISKKAREFVLSQARHQCEASYNNKRCTSKTNLQIDHVRPVSIGGQSEISNLRVLCFHCNQRAHIKNNEAVFLHRNVIKKLPHYKRGSH